jgi:anti-sigma regulatory factor (Ser/Thr protein kinase)
VLSNRNVSDRVAETVELLTSEVVTNAIVHADAAPSLVVRLKGGRVRVEVHDEHGAVPVRRKPDPLAASGRGMEIVNHLAREWGVEHVPGGKRVWFEVPFSAPPLPEWVRARADLVPPREDTL